MEKEEKPIAAVYCPKCFKRVAEDNKTKKIPEKCACGEAIADHELTIEEKTPLIQALHKKENHYRDLNDRAMSGVVLGAILVIVGIIFFNLAYKLDLNNPADNTKHLTTTTFEFWVSVVALVVGGAAFIYGIVQLIYDARHLRVLKHDISSIHGKNRSGVEKTGLWFPEFAAHTLILIRNKQAIRAAEKEREAAENAKKETAGKKD